MGCVASYGNIEDCRRPPQRRRLSSSMNRFNCYTLGGRYLFDLVDR